MNRFQAQHLWQGQPGSLHPGLPSIPPGAVPPLPVSSGYTQYGGRDFDHHCPP